MLIMAACASESLPDPLSLGRDEVSFDVYLGEQQQTRSGTTGEITVDNIKNHAYGFGVYAYYTGTDNWSDWKSSSMFPNYMYNQSVAWSDASRWTYSPLKYWPNGEGTANDATGQGNTQHNVSFFAYAPYVPLNITDTSELNDPTDDPTSGITAINGCAADGPLITYKLNTAAPTQQVDLLYADPMNDLSKQAVNESVAFDFHHALSCIVVQVERVYNGVETDKDPSPNDDAQVSATKIFVSEFSMADSVATEGTFSLQTGEWTSTTASSSTLTVGSDDIVPDLRGTTATDLATIRSYELNNFASHPGVTATATTLTSQPIMFIPPTGGTMSFTPTLHYNFVTHDDDLRLSLTNSDGDQYFGRIPNTVSGSTVTFNVEKGKKYTLLCRIGVESMEFGVSSVDFEIIGVEDWDFPMRFNPSVSDYDKDRVIPVTVGGEDIYGIDDTTTSHSSD